MGYRRVSALILAGCFLAGCATPPTPQPTLSPGEAATRLAQIPTAASGSRSAATAIATATATVAEPTAEPTNAPLPAPTSAPAAPVAAVPAAPAARPKEYVVREGDTLSSIANAYDISIASIQLANGLGESQIVQLGQKLQIPPGKQFPDENVYWFVSIVQPGDTLTGLSSRYGVSVNDLMRVNKLADAANIRIGQALIVPVSVPANPEASTGGPLTESEPPAAAAPAVAAVARSAKMSVAEAVAAVVDVPAPTPAVEIIELQPLAPAAEPIAVPAEAPADNSSARTAADAPAVSVAPAAVSGEVDGMRNTMLALYNQARAEEGLAPLAPSFALQLAAQGHAEDCAQRGYGSHVGSDGTGARTRMVRAGYPGRYTGENWAWARTAEEAFAMWFYRESADGPHRSNIMSRQYADVGFGIVPSHGGFYFIADLGSS